MSEFGRTALPDWVKPAAAVALIIIVLMVAGPRVAGWFKPPPAALPAAEPEAGGGFKVTDAQWGALTLRRTDSRQFRTMIDLDGKVAVNDDRTTPVFSPYSGKVTKLIAHVGDAVVAGGPLLLLQSGEYSQAQSDLVTALGGLAAASEQRRVAGAAEQRLHDLYDHQGAALKDWQQAQLDLANASAAQDAAAIGLAAVRNRLRILGRSDAEIAASEADPELLRRRADVAVPSPISGSVISRQVGPGQYINSAANNGGQIFLLGDLTSVWLIGYLREADVGLVQPGDAVEATVAAYPGRKFAGQLALVAPTVDPASHRVMLRAEVKNSDALLKPETFANLRLISGRDSRDSPCVPESAVLYEGDKAHLWVAHESDKSLSLRPVSVGRTNDGLVEITAGLQAGETVVTKGALFIDRAAKSD